MTTKAKQTSKTSKTAVAFDKAAALAQLAQGYVDFKAQATRAALAAANVLEQVNVLRANKVKIGDVRTCENAKAVMAAMPETLAKTTRANYLTEIRKAVNEGGKLSLNSSRDNAKAKGGKAKGGKGGKGGKAKTGTGNILISIGKAATPADAAEKLLKGFNALKAANDGLAGLAAFLIDALEDAKTKKYNPLAK